MRMKVIDKGARLEVHLLFPDCRFTDLEPALYIFCREQRWKVSPNDGRLGEAVYSLSAKVQPMVTARFTHGFEPPTRAIFENKLPDAIDYMPAARAFTLQAAEEFLRECANRGLITKRARDNALAELHRHKQAA